MGKREREREYEEYLKKTTEDEEKKRVFQVSKGDKEIGSANVSVGINLRSGSKMRRIRSERIAGQQMVV